MIGQLCVEDVLLIQDQVADTVNPTMQYPTRQAYVGAHRHAHALPRAQDHAAVIGAVGKWSTVTEAEARFFRAGLGLLCLGTIP